MNITWKIGGEAGFGIMSTGLMFSKIAVRHGYHIFDYVEYPSLIRGGHNVYEVRVGDTEVFSQEKGVYGRKCRRRRVYILIPRIV